MVRIAGAGLLFLMHTVIGRAIEPKGYGAFSYTLALAGVLAVIAPLGWPTALMRFIVQYMELQHWSLLKGAVKRAYQFSLLSAVLIALVLWGLSYWEGFSPKLVMSLRFAALLLPFLALVELRHRALQALQLIKSSIIPEDIVLPLVMIVCVYLFAITTASEALLTYLVAAFAAFLLGSALLWRGTALRGRAAKPEYKTRSWLIIALPMVFGDFSQVVMARMDVLVLGAMVDMQTVGLYGAAIRIAILNTFVLAAVNTVAAPMIAATFYGGRIRQVRAVVRKAMLVSTLGTLPIFAGMIFFPQFLLGFFGQEFVTGAPLLRILALGQFINAVTGPVGYALLMTERERAFALTVGASALINIAGLLLVVPVWGAVGAATVTAASITLLNGAMYWQVAHGWRHTLEAR